MKMFIEYIRRLAYIKRISAVLLASALLTVAPLISISSDMAEGAYVKTIYVDGSCQDAGNGTRENPYNTLDAGMIAAAPSDTIIVADSVYYGSFSLPCGTAGKPTTLKAADGAKPVLTSSIPLNVSWSVYEGNVYVADIPAKIAELMEIKNPQLFINSVSMVEARWPNIGPDMTTIFKYDRAIMRKGSDPDTIIAPFGLPSGDLVGADVVVWGGGRYFGRKSPSTGVIMSVSGTTIKLTERIDPEPEGMYSGVIWNEHRPEAGSVFYITGALALLDAPGEYYYDASAQKLYFYAPGEGDPNRLNLSLKSKNRYTLDLTGDYITVDGFSIYGGGINVYGDNNIIQNSEILFFDHFIDDVFGRDIIGFMISGSNNVVRRCAVGYTAGAGIAVTGYGNIITDNHIHHCNYSGSWGSSGVSVYPSQYTEVSHNTIVDAGRDLISFWSAYDFNEAINYPFTGCVVRNNYLKNSNRMGNDGGAVYMQGFGDGTEIYENFIDGGLQRDQNLNYFRNIGLYSDSGSPGFNYHHNIIRYVAIGLAGGRKVYNNTIINALSLGMQITFTPPFNPQPYVDKPEKPVFPYETRIYKDNLLVNVHSDYDLMGYDETYTTMIGYGFMSFIDGKIILFDDINADIISSGNTRGTVNEYFRASGDTPKSAGALPNGADMFEYGATWKLDDFSNNVFYG